MNPVKAQLAWPPVVVAGTYQTGVVLMRDLNRRGLRVYGIETKPDMAGFYTIYGKVSQCPNPDTNQAEWVEFMAKLAATIRSVAKPPCRGKPVLIASADQFVSAIADNAEALEPHFTFCRSSATLQGLLATKEKQYELAAQYGLPVPSSRFVRSLEELRAFAAFAHFPCLLKPVHFREWEKLAPDNPLYFQKVATAESIEVLEMQYLMASQTSSEMVVQEIIAGPDISKLVYLSCYAKNGRRIGFCMVRQLRTMPIHFGSASVVEPVSEPEAAAACDKFLHGIGYQGICEIELKRDTRDGVVRMIEANPRYSVTADAAVYAGVEIGWLHYLDLIGQPVTPTIPSGKAFRHIVLERDIACFRSYIAAGLLTWKEFLQSYAPPVFFFDFDMKDLLVTLRTMIRLGKILAGPTVRRFFPKKRSAS